MIAMKNSPAPEIVPANWSATLRAMTTRKALRAALRLPARASAVSASIPSLSCIHLEAGGDGLRLTGTDLAVEAQTRAAGEGAGAACLQASVFRKLLALLPEGPLAFVPVGGRVEVQAGAFRFWLPDHDPSGFPALMTEGRTLALPGAELAQAFRAVVCAASGDDCRPLLTSVNVAWDEDGLQVAANDTHRLHVANYPVVSPEPFQWNLPAEAVRLMVAGLDAVLPWQALLGERYLRVSDGETTIGTRLIEGVYPAYHKVFPSEFEAEWVVGVHQLAGALTRLALVADMRKRSQGMGKVLLAGAAGELHLSANGDEDHAAKVSLAAETGEKAFAINVNHALVVPALECFRKLGVETVRVRLAGELRSVLLEAADCPLRAIVMPMLA